VIYHFCPAAAWDPTAATYVPAGFEADGFVHLSDRGTVHLPATALHRGARDLLLLTVDPALVDAPLRWEPGDPADPSAAWFPHLYGPLPVRAVVRADPWLPGPDGAFAPPSW
jgi:uncharacterized protein (DUF952 family)